MARPLTNELYYWSMVWGCGLSLDASSPTPMYTTIPPIDEALTGPRVVDCLSHLGLYWTILDNNLGPSSRIINIIIYDFRTYHMNFIQNKHVKHKEICVDTQGRAQTIRTSWMFLDV